MDVVYNPNHILPSHLVDASWTVTSYRHPDKSVIRSRTWAEFFAFIQDIFWKLICCQCRFINCSRVRILSEDRSSTIKGITGQQLPTVLANLQYPYLGKTYFPPSTYLDIPNWGEVTSTPDTTFDMTIQQRCVQELTTSIPRSYRCFALIKENKSGRIAPCLSVNDVCHVDSFNHYPAGFPNQKAFDYPRAEVPIGIN